MLKSSAVIWVPLSVLRVLATVSSIGSVGFSGRVASAFLAQSAAGTTFFLICLGSVLISSASNSVLSSGTSQSNTSLVIVGSSAIGITTVNPSSISPG